MKRFLRHKWVVPVAALVLVLAVGAVAWGATGSTGSTDQSTPALGTTATTAVGGGGHPALKQLLTRLKDKMQQNKGMNQERLQSIINLVRDKMTPADQTKLDQLVATAKTQKQALTKAAQDQRNTLKELKGLVDKYLTPRASGAATTTTTVTNNG